MDKGENKDQGHVIVMCRGIQGSGKTTWARKWAEADPKRRIRLNRDDVRNMFGKYWVPSREPLLSSIFVDMIAEAVDDGYDIVVDNMNLSQSAYAEGERVMAKSAIMSDSYRIVFKDFFDVPVEECIRRDSLREHPIGEDAIRATYGKYKGILKI